MSGGLAWIFGANESFVAGFLAVDYVIAGFYTHQELDAALGAFEGFRGGFPDEVAGVGYSKDVEGRDHGRRTYITNSKNWMYRVGQAGISDGGCRIDRSCRVGAQHA